MRVLILETGRPPDALRGRYPDYPAMFEALLGAVDDRLTFETVPVFEGAAPPDPATVDAAVITGSSAGAYEEHAWIAPLERFIRAAAAAGTPQAGICFGHQIMAQAFGGRVEKSDRGWGVGCHAYEVRAAPAWMDPPAPRFALAASHQDQVTVLPEGAEVLAANAHTPYAALAYAHAPAISFQGHPEMSPAFTAALVESRRGVRIPEPIAAAALASLAAPMDSATVARWIVNFFRKERSR